LKRSSESPQEWAERTALEQGLPAKVEDWGALAAIATLLRVSPGSVSGQTPQVGLTRDGSK
jgi:hypothetical protein